MVPRKAVRRTLRCGSPLTMGALRQKTQRLMRDDFCSSIIARRRGLACESGGAYVVTCINFCEIAFAASMDYICEGYPHRFAVWSHSGGPISKILRTSTYASRSSRIAQVLAWWHLWTFTAPQVTIHRRAQPHTRPPPS